MNLYEENSLSPLIWDIPTISSNFPSWTQYTRMFETMSASRSKVPVSNLQGSTPFTWRDWSWSCIFCYVIGGYDITWMAGNPSRSWPDANAADPRPAWLVGWDFSKDPKNSIARSSSRDSYGRMGMAVPWNFPALMWNGERIETQSPQSRGLTGFSPLLNDAEESWQQDVGSIWKH